MEQGTPTISIEIGMLRRLIVDTGSIILQPGILRRDVRVTMTKPYGVTGQVLDIKGLQSVTFTLNGREFTHVSSLCNSCSQFC